MKHNNILTFFSKSIVHKVEQITDLIKGSVEYSHQYFVYIYPSTVLKSQSEDDWNFCILILKFIHSESDFDDMLLILKYFLYRDRYRNKLIDHNNYLTKTIKKVVCYSLKQNLVGSCLKNQLNYNDIVLNPSLDSLDMKSLKLYKSVSKSDVLKICNLFNFFYLNIPKSSNQNLVLDVSNSNDNFMKVHSQYGILNHFDLTVLIAILYQYNHLLVRSDIFKINVASVLNVIGYDTGYSRKKFLNSLKKLSTTTIDCRKQYIKFDSDNTKVTEDYFYSFCGNLLSFENLSTTKLTLVNVQLSIPLIRIFESNNYYALVNWQSFVNLPNTKLRLFYFYFGLNVKVSNYFTEFFVKSLVNKLYHGSATSSNSRVYTKDIRQMLLFFVENQKNFLDFEFQVVLNRSYNLISSIKVRRSKLIII
uniref:Uncharacterized protein n=1 Tax=Gracilariopsis lemaneiformis TaxID=2782 RepID=O46329_GRALE|nr:ORF1 [Gracilariopsis lemaneiformis]